MAFNNFPVGYQPYSHFSQNPSQSTTGLIWVQDEASAKSYPVAPNQAVALWDSEKQTIYLKTADASGMPSIKILDYSIRNNPSNSPEILAESDFASKKDVEYLKDELSSLKAKFDRITSKAKEKADGK